jgi:hypothetical protein
VWERFCWWRDASIEGILSAKGAERGGGPHFADSVRNDGCFFFVVGWRQHAAVRRRLADLKFGHYIGTQDAGLKARRYNGRRTLEPLFADSEWGTQERGTPKSSEDPKRPRAGRWGQRHGTKVPPLQLELELDGDLGGEGFVYDFAVEEMDCAFGVVGVARIVRDHADGGAALVDVLEEFHYGVAIFGV